MKVKITMINGDTFTFDNNKFNNLYDFVEGQIIKMYYTIDPIHAIVIRTSNILKVEHLDASGELEE